jgi:branched-subunit amino acid ABC-type transport system permease component
VNLLVNGLVTGAIFGIAACGLVLTYSTSGIFNFAHGALGMFCAYVYWDLRYNAGRSCPPGRGPPRWRWPPCFWWSHRCSAPGSGRW